MSTTTITCTVTITESDPRVIDFKEIRWVLGKWKLDRNSDRKEAMADVLATIMLIAESEDPGLMDDLDFDVRYEPEDLDEK